MLRLAYEWRDIQRVPRIRLLSGERTRDFVLSRKQEEIYLAACAQPLRDVAILMLETGLRIGEALRLEWPDVTLDPINGARFGFLRVREGKSKNARRIVPLTDRAAAMLRLRWDSNSASVVFANREGRPYLGTTLNHLHRDAFAPKVNGKRVPIFVGDFVLHSLRHTMLTRLENREWMHSPSCELRDTVALWFRSATSTQRQRQWSALSSVCNCPAR